MIYGTEMLIPDQSTYDKIKNIEIEGYLTTAMMLIWEAVGEEIILKTKFYNKALGIDIETNIK